MKIAILGAGATGCVFAGYLKKGGADDIWLIDLWKEHMDKVAKDGLVFVDPSGEVTLTGFRTACSPEEVGPVDILIVLVKVNQTIAAMESAVPCITDKTCVISLQNGLGNEVALEKFVPPARIGYGCGRIGTQLDGPGKCVSRPAQGITNVFIGPYELSDISKPACQYVAECLRKGGLQPEYHDDVRPLIWKKAAANSGFNTVCAALGLDFNHTYNDPNGKRLVLGVLKEAADVAKAMGIAADLYDDLVADIPNTLKSYGDYYPSMAQDLLVYKRQTEVDALSGAIAMYGDRVGVETPNCDVLSAVIKAIEANYDAVYYNRK